MSDKWTAVLAASAVNEGEPSVAELAGAEIALYRVGLDFFATSNICTHAMVQLSDGYLEGYIIECPLHAAQFDIRDGKCKAGPAYIDLLSYDVRVTDGMIELRAKA